MQDNYSEKIKKIVYFILILALIFIIYKLSTFFIDILIIYFLTIFLAVVIKPLTDKIYQKFKISREFSSLILILFFFTIVITLFIILIPNLYDSLGDFIKILQENLNLTIAAIINVINYYLSFIEIKIEYQKIIQNTINQINQNIPQITEKLINLIFSGGKTIFNIILITVLTFYTLKDYEKIRNYKINLFSKIFSLDKENLDKLVYEIEVILRKFLLGQIFAATYIFLFTLITLKSLGVKQYLIVAIISGIFELIPFIGAFLAFSISIIFLLNKGIISILIFIIIATIAYQILAKIIYPNIVGKILNISVITVLISIIIGFKLYGIFGMFIAVPFVAIIKNIIDKDLNKTHL
ncbi:MAG: AI-2E family transporter [bacterium]